MKNNISIVLEVGPRAWTVVFFYTPELRELATDQKASRVRLE